MYLKLIFYILIILSFIESFTQLRRYPQYKNIIAVLILFSFFLLSFLRWERGSDWINYFSFFTNPESYGDESFEKGFTLLNILIRELTDNFTVFLFILACIYYICIGKTILNYCKTPILAITILFVINNYGGIFFVRQTVAIAITAYAFTFIPHKKYCSFIFCVLLAACFHRTSYIFLLAYPIYFLKLSDRKIIIITLIAFISGYIISLFIQHFLGSFGGVITSKLNAYMEAGYKNDINGINPTILYLRGCISRLFLFFILFHFTKKQRKENSITNGIFNLTYTGVLLYIIAGSLNITLARICFYFEVFQIFLIPISLNFSKKLVNRILLFTCLMLYFSIRIHSEGTYKDLFVPYKSIFNKNLPVNTY